MPKYEVQFLRRVWQKGSVVVEARNEDEATERAYEDTSEVDWVEDLNITDHVEAVDTRKIGD